MGCSSPSTGGWRCETVEWPVRLRGVTETVVTTLGPNDRYNVAALGVFAPTAGEPPRARTWGRTRTWRNFDAGREACVQFVRDPVVFVDAALAVREHPGPVLPAADAWVHVRPERCDAGSEGETRWVEWRLHATDSETRRRVVPAFNRGHAAVVEATVAASRLEVPSYDTDELRERLRYLEGVTERCGGPREQAAFERLRELVEFDAPAGDGSE